MVDKSKTPQQPPVTPSGKRAWSAPQLTAYGHVGKLTQGASGNMAETGGMMSCL